MRTTTDKLAFRRYRPINIFEMTIGEVTVADESWKRNIIKSLRLSRRELDLIKTECGNRHIGFSEFVRTAAMMVASSKQYNTEVV